MSVKIITESVADLRPELAKKWDVEVLPLMIRIGDRDYVDGVELTPNRFYELMIEVDELPKTSQVPPIMYEEAVDKALGNGDEVVIISISSHLSGCCRNAMMVASEHEGQVYAVDSLSGSIGMLCLIDLAVRLRDEGKSAKEIYDILEEKKRELNVIFLLDTLDYVQKGGRISKTTALAGRLLGIKPVIGVDDGKIAILGRARGSKSGCNMLIDSVLKNGGIDFKMPIYFGYSGLTDIKLKKYIEDSKPLYEHKVDGEFNIVQLGSTIGTYSGPGAIGFAYFGRKMK